jgi:hypothetical protein
VLAIVGLVYLALTVGYSIQLHQALFESVKMIPLVVATCAFGALWLLLRGAPRPHAFVRAVELSTLFAGTSAFSAMALVMPLVAAPESIVRGALTCVLLVYAVYVPSTARRTLVVASLMTVPLLACVFVAYRSCPTGPEPMR